MMLRTMRTWGASLVSVAALLCAQQASAAEIREHAFKFAHVNPAEHPQGQGAKKFAELVAQKSGGKITIKLFPGSSLGGDMAMLTALRGGTVEMTVMNTGLLNGIDPAFSVVDLPFAFGDFKEVDAVVDGPVGKKLYQKLESKDLVGLAYWDLGFRNVTNSKRPVAKLEDLQGLKLRVVQSPVYLDLFNALGANALAMPFAEVYSALEQKAVDGQENPATVILANKLGEVQKYMSMTRHMYNPQSVLFSKKVWDTLNADEQKLIRDAIAEATAYQRKVSRDAEAKAIDDLKKGGVQVNDVSPQERARMREKAKPVFDKYAKEVGADIIGDLNSALATVRK